MQNRKNKKGTTLIEITLYFALVGVFLLFAMTFAIQILNIYSLSNNIQELQSNIDFIGQRMVYTIQTADSVNDSGSVFDNDNGSLSLNMSNPTESPTTFYLSSGDIFMTIGSNDPLQLNTDWVTFDSLRFHKISADKVPDQIIIDATLSPAVKDIAELQHDFVYHLSVSLRKL